MTHTPAKPRRWFTFGLRTMFVLLTLACVSAWLGPDAWLVYQRRTMLNWVTENGGKVRALSWYMYPRERFPGLGIPRIREWMGDEAIAEIELPYGTDEASILRLKAAFREADSIRFAYYAQFGGGTSAPLTMP